MQHKAQYNLAVLYLECQRDKYPNSFAVLRDYLDKLFNCKYDIVKIDNNIEHDYFERIDNSTVIINGDNKCREFSGLQKGVDYLRAQVDSITFLRWLSSQWKQLIPRCLRDGDSSEKKKYDAILFVNDSFLVYGRMFADAVLKPEVVAECVERNGIAGIVDKSEELMELDGYNVTEWVRTNCFFMAAPVLNNILSLCSVDDQSINKFIPFEPSEKYFSPDAPINENLKTHIINWLSTGWHSKFDLYENWDLFRFKTCAILNEKLLTARISDNGFDVICATKYL